MKKKSAGILMYKFLDDQLQLLLVHPGGPFWKNKDNGAWSIPKGEFENDEQPDAAALREFEEETGVKPQGALRPLTPVKMKSGKMIFGFCVEGDLDVDAIHCNTNLVMSERNGVEIDYCPECRGVWLDRGELDKIIERSAQFEAPRQHHDDRHPSQYQNAPFGQKPYKKKKDSFLGDLFDF